MKYYDELVITCGQQFQHPEYLKESLELDKELEKGKTCERMLMDDPDYQPHRVPAPPEMPENVFVINSLFEANINLRKLLRMVSDAKQDEALRLCATNRVVVYGDCIEAYSCMTALLELGLSSDKIVFVEPFPSEDPAELRVNCFNDEVVDERVQAAIAKLGIHVHRRSRFTGWHIKGSRVVSLKFMSPLHAFRVPCFALFYYGVKAIDLHAFRAINECGLVYDGGLVVGPTFDTNDPHIYAAGTCVRYSRRLYAKQHLHRFYCSEDVGEALAKLFLRKMDPFVMGDPDIDPCPSDILPRYNSSLLNFPHASIPNLTRIALGKVRRWQPVQKFESPVIHCATFPGPLYYMKVRKPGPDIPMEVEMSLPHQGHTLTTNRFDNYCRLKLDALHRIVAMTCLSHRRVSHEVLAATYGKHEAFFDKLLQRYMMNKIDDLLEFFVQPWMAALYQETFDDLLVDIYQQDVGTVYDIVKSHFSLFDAAKMDLESSETKSSSSSSRGLDLDASCNVPSCGFTSKEAQNLGTFRSVLDRYIARTSFKDMINVKDVDIPSECGQAEATRNEARGFWNCVGGEHIVNAHLARYLDRNSVCNPHYATYKPELL
ncbi:cilia- and flagella-associated protein 61-like [Choristoneura fumiferana]|uniref:cilia- and flagella-associated protein 61-like n=1 Tax=Choristoneura fumiferana TaxID=7141 RepID=UPI003D15BE65